MRVTVSHNRPKTEVMRSVDHSFDDLFRDIGFIPIQFAEERRSWQGSTLAFSVLAKMGFLSTSIKGTVDVTDTEVTIDADLGFARTLDSRSENTSVPAQPHTRIVEVGTVAIIRSFPIALGSRGDVNSIV